MKAMLDLMKQSYRTKLIDSFREELGIADYGHPIFDGQHSPELVLALFSSVFGPPQPDWPPQARTTGFAFYDGHHEMAIPAELSRFLDDGPAPIVFTLGTSAVWVAQDFFRESIKAAKMLGKRAVLLIGDLRNLPDEALPSDFLALNYAPFEYLIPRSCAMVHHAGVGTTSQGLRSGVPTLIVPFAFDQPDNAAHAKRLGTSRVVYRKDYFASRVARELELLLGNPEYARRAAEVGQQLRSENGAATASDFIESFIQGKNQNKRESEELTYASSD
jgi:UDP:flavonoid glycosyltransferase YjiC (YdhE family)